MVTPLVRELTPNLTPVTPDSFIESTDRNGDAQPARRASTLVGSQ
jgi:hypothetical protein